MRPRLRCNRQACAEKWFSAWWLKQCRFGPFEWLWRSLTYGSGSRCVSAIPYKLCGDRRYLNDYRNDYQTTYHQPCF